MRKITDIIKNKFTYSLEFVPPRNGTNIDKLLTKLEGLRNIELDFLSVTKGAGGSLRGGTLPLSYFAHSKFFIPSIMHFTCREINSNQVENELVDQHYFGIKNILALRGDLPAGTREQDLDYHYKYAYQLVEKIKQMNYGQYSKRINQKSKNLKFIDGTPTNFCIGVAAHPNSDKETRIKYLKKKVDAGANFAITQMIFDAEIYKRFIEEAKYNGIFIPVIPGIFPITSLKKLNMIEKNFKTELPAKFKKTFEGLSDNELRKKGIELAVNLCKQLKEYGAPGIHLFIFQDLDIAKKIFKEIKSSSSDELSMQPSPRSSFSAT